jgi:replicative DNA helicase
MSLEKKYGLGFLRAVITEGYETFARINCNEDIFDEQTKQTLSFIEKHYNEHKKTPDIKTVEFFADTDIETMPEEPIRFWLRLLEQQHLHERLTQMSKEIEKKKQDPYKAFEGIRKAVDDFEHKMMTDQVFDLFDPVLIEELLYEQKNPGFCIPTPWPTLNSNIRGWFPQNLTIIAGRPGTGKSWLMLDCAQHALRAGYSCLVVTTEMAYKAMMLRFLSLYFKITYSELKHGLLPDYAEEWLKTEAAKVFSNPKFIKIMGDDMELKIETIFKHVRILKPDLVLLDGAYLLRSDRIRDAEKHNRIAELFNYIKGMAKNLGVSVICTTQMNRAQSQTENSKAGLHRLAFSDNAGMVADNVFMLTIEGEENNQQRYLDVVKLREGEPVNRIAVDWNFESMEFGEKKVSHVSAI